MFKLLQMCLFFSTSRILETLGRRIQNKLFKRQLVCVSHRCSLIAVIV